MRMQLPSRNIKVPYRKRGCCHTGILPRTRIFKISNSQLFSTYLFHGGTLCYRAGGLTKFRMLFHSCNIQTQKVSWRSQQAQVMAPIAAAWDRGHFVIAPHQKNVVCCICSSASLSLLETILFPVHCKHTHNFFFFSDSWNSQTSEAFSKRLFEINILPH